MVNSDKKGKDFILTIIGAILFLGGMALIKFGDVGGLVRIMVCIVMGIGCMLFGHSLGGILSRKALESSPELAENWAIEQGDERNRELEFRSKAKSFDLMIYVFSSLFFCLILLDVELVVFVLVTVAYLFVTLSQVYFRSRLEKKM